MVCKGAELHRDAFKLTDTGAEFADGSTFDCDAVVACTGYRNSFPMFDHPDCREDVICSKCGCRTKDLNAFGQNPRRLYKQIFVPVFPDGQVAFFGPDRPLESVPPTAEMQAKYFALVVDGRICLPDTKCMEEQAKKDQANWEWRFGYDAKARQRIGRFPVVYRRFGGTDGLPPAADEAVPHEAAHLVEDHVWPVHDAPVLAPGALREP